MWFFVSVDLKTLEDEKAHAELGRYLSSYHTQDLIGQQSEVDTLSKAYFEKSLAEASAAPARLQTASIEWVPALEKEAAASLRLEHLRQKIASAVSPAAKP